MSSSATASSGATLPSARQKNEARLPPAAENAARARSSPAREPVPRHLADLGVGGRDGGHLGDLLLGLDVDRDGLDGGDRFLDGPLDAPLEGHGVGAGGHVAQALVDHGPRQHGGGGGAVAGHVVGLLGDLLDELGADLLVGVLELDLLGDGHTIVGDRGGAPLLLEHHVAALGAEGDAYRVGELVHAALERPSGLLVEGDDLRHPCSSSRASASQRRSEGPLALYRGEC